MARLSPVFSAAALQAMRALVAVHGEQPAAGGASVSRYLALQEGRHSPLANEVEIFNETVVVGVDITLLDQLQVRAGKLVAFEAEIDLLPGELLAQSFFMDAAPATWPAADASRLGRIEDPAAEVAVHAAGSHQLAPHGHGA